MSAFVYFQLGKIPELSLAELAAFYPAISFSHPHPHLALCEDNEAIHLENILKMSGGIVTCGRVLAETDEDIAALVERAIGPDTRSIALSLLLEQPAFSVKQILDSVKSRKKQTGQALRYVLPASGMTEMRSAVLYHEMKHSKRFQHFIVWKESEVFRIAETTVVQNVDEWSRIDYGKPSRRIHEGMLPPKVARMMLNLGLGHLGDIEEGPVLYDPFCGSGTVLIEGMRSGCRVMGSDVSKAAAESSGINTKWYQNIAARDFDRHPIFHFKSSEPECRVFVADAVHLTRDITRGEVDLVVTEPYMGPLFTSVPDLLQAKNQQKGLFKLYLGFFKSLRNVLKRGGVVVFSLPFYRIQGDILRIALIDRLRDIGYNPIIPSIDYFVDHTIVGREIIILRLEN